MSGKTNRRRFHGKPEFLRTTERLGLLDVDRVIALSVEGLESGRILDVGTGTGVFAEAFHASGFAVAGIDVNGVMLEEARRLVPEAEFRQARAEAIPYENAEFDLVFLGLLLHETDDPELALREARRVSRAKVVVLEWPFEDDGHNPPLEHRLSVERILNIAKRAGLKAVKHQRLAHTELYRMTV